MTASIDTVFPEPDSPTIPRTSPSAIENERPSTARTSPSSVRNETLRSRTSSSGAPSFMGSLSGTAHARIEDRIDEIDRRVRDHDEEGRVHDGGHDHGQVEVLE